MRIIRTDDEKVIAAESNNSTYGQSSDDRFDYDMDISFSEMQFRNEIVKDRMYGTSNIKPMARNKSVMKERLYKEAIEESSRMKTGGYYNQIFGEANDYRLHDNVPGRLKEKVNEEKMAQINDALAYNMNHDKEINQISFRMEEAALKMTKDAFNNFQDNKQNMNQIHNVNQKFNINQNSNKSINQNINRQPNMNNIGVNGFINQPGFVAQNDKYDDIMNKVNADIIQQNRIDPSTKMVNDGRKEFKDEGNRQNNIPYKKTAVFEKGSNASKENNNGLVVRDCKSAKNNQENQQNDKQSAGSWLCGIVFMIIPILGFIVSGIVSLAVPKDKAYKNFARVCLTCHMLVSVAITYLYLSGTISIELINNYLSRF